MALAFALQAYGNVAGKGDIRAAIDLCKLIADIEDDMRSDCGFLCVFRRDTPRDLQAQCVQVLKEKFSRAEGYVARNFAVGHPHGANALWHSTMAECQGQFNEHRKNPKTGRFPFNGVLTFEPDSVPMRKDWISALTKEWNERVIAVGDWDEENEDPEKQQVLGWPDIECMGHRESDHINGNMVIRPDYAARHKVVFTTNAGWDMCMKEDLMRTGIDTNLIIQHYRRMTINRQEIPFIKKNDVTPALFHGVQAEVGKLARKFMREILVEGRPVEA